MKGSKSAAVEFANQPDANLEDHNNANAPYEWCNLLNSKCFGILTIHFPAHLWFSAKSPSLRQNRPRSRCQLRLTQNFFIALHLPNTIFAHNYLLTTRQCTASDSYTITMTDDTGTTCAFCSKPTTRKCLGCRKQVFCNMGCLKKGWPAHKRICKEAQLEKTLARVAEVVHEAYLTFRENTWDGAIIRVDDQGGALIIHDGNPWDNLQWFRKFPYAVVPPNRRAKLGVLTAWTCDEPYAFLHALIVKLLQGMYFSCPNCIVFPAHATQGSVSTRRRSASSFAKSRAKRWQSTWPRSSRSPTGPRTNTRCCC